MKKYQNLLPRVSQLYLIMLMMLLPSYVIAIEYTPAELTQAADTWLQQELAQLSNGELMPKLTALDDRIGAKSCAEPVEFSLSQPISQRQNTILIQCSVDEQWKLYLSVRIDEIVQAVILKQNIATGAHITADMLALETRERRFVRGSLVSEPRQIIGAKAKRSLSMGQMLTLQDVCLVCKGDVVTISISNNGLNVAATGIAQQDGSLGDTIELINRQSKRTVRAEVMGVSSVSIKF
ncbi:flagellar basal body P-ring formation chaperone FlgA [Rheinheimera salexigens]|uniref:Flagella basal body P-ring formation protein FlgA n=1 Tax=Rheinheimera salexigens TaxID=1628148 RepID=A0A1E7Q802_9GAMM|nr:flagellar basal body P-ring formation chaperone FlgA [Rheinheimera salexigens]OEY70315.1 flagella basal body P-ring formation protein FlgA [Rheinheimera salexigens]